ncbi:protealysin inhibitor emfourin [Streptomyces sp. Caat 7-52]|uniref:protealysin inhibitor emfourin n=1 Tax=Streptomyces sp. Caat 7-52 TaxID=2949637 RepID=UPI0020350C22|nr:protealysin inhibitor emfourin [Streptomyces sp. Caat 7-52]
MKVVLETYGGLAAAARQGRPPEVLDTDALPETAAAELARLLAAVTATPQQDRSGRDRSGRARDAMSHTITVQDGDRVTVLEQSDAAMTPAYADLLTWLRKHFAHQ